MIAFASMNHKTDLSEGPENKSSSRILNLDEPSKVIMTRAKTAIATKNIGENSNTGVP